MTAAATQWNGNTMGGDKPRLSDDAYYTPDALALAICRKIDAEVITPDVVIEPSAGNGAFVRAARAVWQGKTIHGIEPNRESIEEHGIDRMMEWTRDRWESPAARVAVDRHIVDGALALIVGNPPFSLAEEHIRIALRRLGHAEAVQPRPRFLCFLLRASMLAGNGRFRSLWGPQGLGGLRYVWHVVGRPGFTPDGKQDAAEYAVLVWQAGYRGPYEGGWLEWKPGRAP